MVLGVDLGGTNIRAGLIRGKEILKSESALLKEKDSLESTLNQLISVISGVMEPGVTGIGIGVPSVVDAEQGIVYNAVNIPSWKKVELKDILEKEFGVPVFVNNDVNCFILGEYTYGSAGIYSSVAALTLGTGLGAGIILNGKLYSGSNGGAGEIGYLPYLDSDFESYVSGMFFDRHYSVSAIAIHQEALKGDMAAIRAWQVYGRHLGNVIKAVMYAYDPEAILLGGSISKAFSLFELTMYQEIADFKFPESLKKINITVSSMENISVLGAAALVGHYGEHQSELTT
jgi:glucokinase